MAQVVAYFTKVPITDQTKAEFAGQAITFMVAGFTTISSMYTEMKESGTHVPSEEKFTQDCLNKAKDTEGEHSLSYFTDDGVILQMRAILLFDNVPRGRHVIEIVSAINFAAAQHDLIYKGAIRYSPGVFEVVSTPNECIDPTRFDWDIPALITSLRNVLCLVYFLDFKDNDQLHPEVMAEIQTRTPDLVGQ